MRPIWLGQSLTLCVLYISTCSWIRCAMIWYDMIRYDTWMISKYTNLYAHIAIIHICVMKNAVHINDRMNDLLDQFLVNRHFMVHFIIINAYKYNYRSKFSDINPKLINNKKNNIFFWLIGLRQWFLFDNLKQLNDYGHSLACFSDNNFQLNIINMVKFCNWLDFKPNSKRKIA